MHHLAVSSCVCYVRVEYADFQLSNYELTNTLSIEMDLTRSETRSWGERHTHTQKSTNKKMHRKTPQKEIKSI